MSQCKIWLDNYQHGHYYSGSQIQGRVLLNFNSETKFRALKLRLIGQEHTEWMGTENYTEPGSNETKTRDVRLYSDNNIISTESILIGGNTCTVSLPPGQHIYSFNLMLPTNIPSSYNCEYGSIIYKVKAIVDKPMAVDYEDEFIFVLVSLIDLNQLQNPQLLQSTSYSDDKTVCCLCCAQGPITMDVTLPKRTLIPGEILNIPVRISNMSNTNIESLELKLQQKIVCKLTTSTESKSLENNVISLNEVGVGAHGEHTFTFPVQLPNNFVAPNFSGSKLFKVNYTYKIIAHLPGVHTALAIDMYPEVGNIEIGQQAPIAGFGESAFGNLSPTGAASYPPAYPPNQHPPSSGGYPQFPTYPPAVVQPFPQPPGAYPPQGNPYPPPGNFQKAQEAGIYPTAPAPLPEQELPPSYASVSQ